MPTGITKQTLDRLCKVLDDLQQEAINLYDQPEPDEQEISYLEGFTEEIGELIECYAEYLNVDLRDLDY